MKLVKTITEDKLHLTGLYSESLQKDTIIIHIHGMGGDPYAEDWYPHFHDQFPKAGISFLSVQHRGTGCVTAFNKDDKYTLIGDAYEIFEESKFDIEAWVQFAIGLGYKKIILEAHSLGPSKVLYYCSQYEHSKIVALVLIAPTDMLWSAQSDKEEYDSIRAEAERIMLQGKSRQLITRELWNEYVMSAKSFLDFFTEGSNMDVFCYSDRPHNWSLFEKITVPVFCGIGTKDDSFENTSKAKLVLESKFSNVKTKQVMLYEGADHAFTGFEKQLIDDIIAFLKGAIIFT